MCMGLGCNAAGVVGCRIIDSPRERRIAILTNSFMPCNGRFPILITMAALCCGAAESSSLAAAGIMTLLLLLGVIATLGVSKLLSLTILRGEPSSFTLELPPYRKPKIGQLIVRSVFDRTLYVLGRAAAVAAPAGLVIWLLANIRAGDMSLLSYAAAFFEPAGRLIGLDGVVICAFLLGFPANEIVLPLILMGYSAASGGFMALGSDAGLAEQLTANGWSTLSFVNMMLLTLFHFPCSTTVLTIRRESGSLRDTLLAMTIPTVLGYGLCMITTFIWNLLT
ncbi:MAG: ferrous iron transporter B [Clostridia bacterium]|nr:ferrous iron transporter B [Clostridia bacterium]